MVSEDTLVTLYQTYHNLKHFGHYSLFEIDDMYPYERGIYFSMLKNTLDEKKKLADRQRGQ
jgi:hypothetical protein